MEYALRMSLIGAGGGGGFSLYFLAVFLPHRIKIYRRPAGRRSLGRSRCTGLCGGWPRVVAAQAGGRLSYPGRRATPRSYMNFKQLNINKK